MRLRDIFFFDACSKIFRFTCQPGEGAAKIRVEIEFQISVFAGYLSWGIEDCIDEP
jgi:hypothetical protein